MSEEEFKEKIHKIAEANRRKLRKDFDEGIIYLRNFSGVSRFRSIRRAIRRGLVSMFGDIYPKRPFNNRRRNKSGDVTYRKRRLYEQFTHKQGKTC